jgi:rare lipoprotein A
MRYLNRGALKALSVVGLVVAGGAMAQQKPVGVPSVAPPGSDAAPPPNLPGGGPSATSGSTATARFDEVGYAAIDGDMRGVTAAAASLRPGSYVEITALDNGRVILAMVAPGKPPAGRLAALSMGAARALGAGGGGAIAVRIREVQPQAGDEAALKRGQPASPRLDAPASLLTGLRARLADVASAQPAKPASPVGGQRPVPPTAHSPAAMPPASHAKPPVAKPASKPAPPKAEPAKPAATGRYHVQVGAFANEANARKLAARLGGHVSPSGKLWLVELGPFADARAAQQARDGAAKHGYGDARVRKD